MKNLFNESWGQVDHNQNQKRLVMTLKGSSQDQLEQIYHKVVKTVKENDINSLLVDVRNRTGSTDQDIATSEKYTKEMMNNGLQRLAILRSQSDKNERHLTDNFISDMGKDSRIRFFDNQQEANSWLESGGKDRRAA